MKAFFQLLLILLPTSYLSAQTFLTGVVRTKSGAPVPGAFIRLQHSGTEVLSDTSGSFAIPLRSSPDILTASCIGYVPNHLPVTTASRFLTITLADSAADLDNVVVVGYGTTTRRYNTGSIAVISGADLTKQPVANPLAALQGRLTGLNITQSNGLPGSSFAVQVRGQTSLMQGSAPLFIIDGVPYAPNNTAVNNLSSAAASYGSGLSPFSSLNPADIESITVLKDADATAIYGSRGANGVILITTKKKTNGKTEFSLTGSTGWSVIPRQTGLLTTSEYVAMRKEAFRNDGTTPEVSTAPDLLVWDTTRYTNFQKLLTGGVASNTDMQASLSGGSETTRFLVSGGYHRETTVFPSDLHDKRGSLNLSLDHTTANRKLGLSLSGLYSAENNSIVATDLSSLTRLPPNTPAFYDSTGALSWQSGGVSFDNPLSYLKQRYRALTNSLVGRAVLSYHPLPRLTLRMSGGYNSFEVSEVNINPITSQNPLYNPQGYSQFGSTRLESWILEPQVEYSWQRKEFRLVALAGGTVQENTNKASSLFAYGYRNDQLLESQSAAGSLTVLTDNNTAYRYAALFGRVTASLRNTYLLNLSGRRDGSSRFGPGKQFASFGAAGAGWIFSNETWMKKGVPFLSFGKLRASYGITGNDQIGDYNYLNTWSPASYPYNGVSGLYPTRLFNPLYSWETNRKAELGLELRFLRDRISVTADGYRNRSSNQLVNSTLPAQTGFPSLLINLPATIQNSGFEATLVTQNLKGNSFSWTTTLTLTIPKNKLVSFPGLATSAYAGRYQIGKPVTIVKGYHFTGVDPQTGVFTFEDINKDGQLNADDIGVIADPSSRCYGGILNEISVKGWSVDVFFQFVQATGTNALYALYNPVGLPPGSTINQPLSVLSRWQSPGDVSSYQQFTTTPGTAAYGARDYMNVSDGVYGDASFLRLKNVALSYALPRRIYQRLGITGIRVYAQAQNMLTITGYGGADPETQNPFALPPLRTVTTGIQLTF